MVYFRAREFDILDFQTIDGHVHVSQGTTNTNVPAEFRGFSHTFKNVEKKIIHNTENVRAPKLKNRFKIHDLHPNFVQKYFF